MTRPKAISKVKKLLALARDRAATGPERQLAKEKASELIERFELSRAEIAPEPARRPRAAPVYAYATGNATASSFSYTIRWGGG